MAHSIAETSLKAYTENQETLKTDKAKVRDHIKKHGPITIEETAEHMGKRASDVSGRFTQLMDEGKIRIKDRKGETMNGNACRRYTVTQQ